MHSPRDWVYANYVLKILRHIFLVSRRYIFVKGIPLVKKSPVVSRNIYSMSKELLPSVSWNLVNENRSISISSIKTSVPYEVQTIFPVFLLQDVHLYQP